jgi:SSS family solute:Na+ symporter
MRTLPLLDIVVLLVYVLGTIGLGCFFMLRSRSTERFMAAGRSLPGWLVGLSIFGTYVSSISFLAIPGKAFVSNWNPLAFSLALPLATWIAVRWFVPFYRQAGEISAYNHLEHRFGSWARSYAVFCYLLTQMARMGAIMYLLGLPLYHLLGWDIRWIIVATGATTTLYTMLGGIEGVIWTDAIQSVVLILGALCCAVIIPFDMPEGPSQLFRIGWEQGKFSLGSFGPSLAESTFWVVLVYGLFMNLQNFGIDQTYVQRYLTAKSEREAGKSVWFGAMLYLPVTAFFLFIGTALFAYYTARPELLPAEIQAEVAHGKGDNVFPLFIVDRLPAGLTGLVIAAIFSAAMSTLSASLNSSATLTLSDLYKRFFRPEAGERESMWVLYLSTLAWGVVGTCTALAMIRVASVLDAWWQLSSTFSGGMLGLFLLGIMSRRATNAAALAGVAAGILAILWLTFSPGWTSLPGWARSPFEGLLATVFGTLIILLVGLLISRLDKLRHSPSDSPKAPTS